MKYVTADDAPILIMHGTKDPLVLFDQSVQFEKALKAAGVRASLVEITGAGHGFSGPEVSARVRQFLECELLGRAVTLSVEPIELQPQMR